MKQINYLSDTLAYIGPDVKEGALPALFYFALSAEETLEQSPYNQPADYLPSNMRLFSMTLPDHGKGHSPTQAFSVWAQKIQQGEDILSPFFLKVQKTIEGLIQEGVILKKQCGVIGLSRGAFIACHVAALCKDVKTILGFAPLTRLSLTEEFTSLKPLVQHFDLHHLTPLLYHCTLRFYIGNLDERVGTSACFSFVHNLALKAQSHKLKSPPIELIISPSIGYKGHGTSPSIFEEGSHWIIRKLCHV